MTKKNKMIKSSRRNAFALCNTFTRSALSLCTLQTLKKWEDSEDLRVLQIVLLVLEGVGEVN